MKAQRVGDGRTDWRQISEDLDQVSVRLRSELMWLVGDLVAWDFGGINADSLRYAMFFLEEARRRTSAPSDLAAIERAKNALLEMDSET